MKAEAINDNPALTPEVTDTVLHRQYQLPLRGESLNPMIDAATPLLGMVMRMRDMGDQPLPDQLYQQVVTDIQAIEQFLQTKGYEPGAIVSFRYMLCTFIDETALGHGWNSKNEWLQQSLLVRFHNETWGGEKVFQLLERLMGEPKRYQHLLEFIYLCFCLGYRGRYKVASQKGDDFEHLFRRLHQQLHTLRGEAPATILHSNANERDGRYRLGKRLTIKHLFWSGTALLAVVYGFYAVRLHSQTENILQQLNNLLS
ncbi:type IV / VI secretion system protein, DotU family [Photorhabdus khanii NC19]|uniref:Type IV / VI secretion system protein, DotU family n=2 Tax=Photorhabdus khanii TaxID=1004150 RepID=W3V8W2_9GAMM|nr:type IVB secretion system protein IcmH/DotU [Photorhabdus khanii]ETS31484.1 type IV / VI secretion system protein, DotU family [Photorhabdus khanii NC19]MQL49842.1 DotU family type IV/VI secretion system protein [Photorhabdus khanii]